MTDPYDRLPSPDEVGQSEYRLIHEFITDLRTDGADYSLIQSSLHEIERWARSAMIEYIRETNLF